MLVSPEMCRTWFVFGHADALAFIALFARTRKLSNKSQFEKITTKAEKRIFSPGLNMNREQKPIFFPSASYRSNPILSAISMRL